MTLTRDEACELVDGHHHEALDDDTFRWDPSLSGPLVDSLPVDGPLTRATFEWAVNEAGRWVGCRFQDAPAVVQALSFHGGDEDYVLVAAHADSDRVRDLAERMAVMDVQQHVVGDLAIFITAHA